MESDGKTTLSENDFLGEIQLQTQCPSEAKLQNQFLNDAEPQTQFPGQTELQNQFPGQTELQTKVTGQTELQTPFLGQTELQTQFPGQTELQTQVPGGAELQNQKLVKHVAHLENDLRLAAEIGKQLLSTNQDLSQQMENLSRDYSKKIESLEQERHEAQLWREQRVQQDKDRDEEVEYLRAHHASQRQHLELREQAAHVTALNQLKKQVVTLQSELEEVALANSHLEKKAQESEQRAESLQRELTDCVTSMNETCSEEMGQLHAEVNTLNALKWELEAHLSDSQREVAHLKLSLTRAQSEAGSLRTELEEQQCHATSYFNALERSREEVQDLKVQLDVIFMETQDQKRKGNSLFGEVEDRRLEAERRMIGLKVQNDTLKKQYNMIKENLKKFKLQMAALLAMSTGRADAGHMERLQDQLHQALSDVALLTKRLATTTSAKVPTEGWESWESLLNQPGNEFAQYVNEILKKKDAQVHRGREEQDKLQTQVMLRNQQVLEYERRVYILEQERERFVGAAMKQRLRIDELTIKYEPDLHKAVQLPGLRAEKLPDHAFGPTTHQPANKENEPRAPPRPLEVPDHIKATLHAEVITDPGPLAEPALPGGLTASRVSGGKKVVLSSLPDLQGKCPKKITFNDVVDVVEIEAAPSDGQGRRARRANVKVTSVKATPRPGSEECITQ